MKKVFFVFIFMYLLPFFGGCAATTGIDPHTLTSPEEKALYDLMERRCQAINTRDMTLFESIYAKDSPELLLIKTKGIPMWEKNGVTFSISSLKRISVVDHIGAASFTLRGANRFGKHFLQNIEVLYEKEGTQWKIVSAGMR